MRPLTAQEKEEWNKRSNGILIRSIIKFIFLLMVTPIAVIVVAHDIGLLRIIEGLYK